MPRYAYDRLSAQDNHFLLWERGNVRMHVASASYAGTMHFGFNADPDIVPDLAGFTAMMQRSIERVALAAGAPLAGAAAKTPGVRAEPQPTSVDPRANGNPTAVAT